MELRRNKMKNEQRNIRLSEIRAAEGEGHIIEGYAAVYDQPTDIGGIFQETIAQGAFDGADLSDVPMLANHNDNMIAIARSRNNNLNSTLQLIPDTHGLKTRANLDTENNSSSSEVYSAVSRGDVTGMSFTFTVENDTWDNLEGDYPHRTINKVAKVYEVSVVNFPAYKGTEIHSRSSQDALESAKATLESEKALDSANNLELRKAKTIFAMKAKLED